MHHQSRIYKLISLIVVSVIALGGLPSKVMADVFNAPSYYSIQPNLSYEITTNITSSWINHESIDLVLANTGNETIHNWYITFNTPYNIDNIWNGALYETDGNGTYTITSNGWNQDIHTGESVTVGITFSSDTETELSVDPTWYLLNTQETVVDASQYTLEYTEYSAWETGFTGQLTLTPQVDCQHWELSFGSNREITAVSSAVLISEGENNYAITHDENNMRLFAGTAYNFGIQGVNTEDPLDMSNVELNVVDLAYHLTDDADVNGVPDYLDFIGGGSIVDPTPTPTPVPTDVPTETPTTEPTGTETPTPTEEPTPTPIIDYESDQDLDGLPDYIEDQLGTDPLKADTDDDLLTDYIEVMIGYDPTNPDTDNNGVTDGNEDCDNDGLSNAYELNLGTNPVMEDTDCDRLNDGDEVNVYGTDPLVPDSDGDGICDGDEVSMGKNPSDPTDGATKISQSLTQEINNAEDPAITSVTVTADMAGKIDRVLDIRDYYNIDVYSTDVYGRIGSPINFECDEEFDSATIVIHYDETQLGDVLEEDIGVLWFDEENGEYIEQEQAVVDVVNNTITLELSHFSTYVVCSLSKWRNPILPDYSDYLYDARTYEYNIRNMPNVGSLEETEDEAWASFQAENGSNWVRVYTISMYHVSSSAANYYTYRWIIMDNTDTDEDGVPNYIERLGVLGSNHCIYHSNLMKEDSDDDGLRDSDELGNLLIRTSFSYYKPIIIYLIRNANGEIQLLYLDDSVSFDSNDLGPWMTRIVSFGTDPTNPDTDGDSYNDAFDLKPLIEADYSSDYVQVSDINTYDSYMVSFFNENSIDMNETYAQREPTLEDYELRAYCLELVNIFRNTMPNATYALSHFLDGSGDMLTLDMYQLIAIPNGMGLINYIDTIASCYANREIDDIVLQTYSYTATAYYYSNLSHLLTHAKSVLKDGETITIMRTTQPYSFNVNGFPQALELDWECTLGVGGSWAGVAATVTRIGNDYIVEYRYSLYDAYNWSHEFPFVWGLPPDSSMRTMLHMTGLACEYFIYGEFTNTFTIPRSRIDDLNQLMELIE